MGWTNIIFALCKLILFVPVTIFFVLFTIIPRLVRGDPPLPPVDISVEPEGLRDPKHGKHGSLHLKKRNIEIHYVAKGNSSKPLMLFIHGFPEFWYSWRHQLSEFGGDYYAVAIDLTGYGGSSKPTEQSRYEVSEIRDDIKEFILELGYKSCVLVGHDWGGVISFEVAFHYPEIIDRLIIANSTSVYGYSQGLSLTQIMRSSYIFFFNIPYLAEYYLGYNQCSILKPILKLAKLTDEELMFYRYTFTKGGFTPPLNYYRNLMKHSFVEYQPKSSIPTLIVWGVKDIALGQELAVSSAQSFDHCVIKYVGEASHWVNQEYPNEFNKHIRDFLA